MTERSNEAKARQNMALLSKGDNSNYRPGSTSNNEASESVGLSGEAILMLLNDVSNSQKRPATEGEKEPNADG